MGLVLAPPVGHVGMGVRRPVGRSLNTDVREMVIAVKRSNTYVFSPAFRNGGHGDSDRWVDVGPSNGRNFSTPSTERTVVAVDRPRQRCEGVEWVWVRVRTCLEMSVRWRVPKSDVYNLVSIGRKKLADQKSPPLGVGT